MIDIIYLLIALAVCVSVHEAAHAWTAYLLGDPTAKMEGRVSLNPLRHLDPLGTIMIFIAHFGWGRPVPFNYHNLRHPRRDAALIAAAGPLSNLLTALLIAFIFKYAPSLPDFVFQVLRSIFNLSIILFLFNLLPIAPLDGSKFIGLFLPASAENWYQHFLAQGPFYLILLIVFDRLLQLITANLSFFGENGFSFLATFLLYGYEAVTALIVLAT